MPTFLRVNRRVEPIEKPMPPLALYSHNSDKVWGSTSLWKAVRDLEKLRWEIDWACHKHGIRLVDEIKKGR